MTTEIQILAWSVLLGIFQVLLTATFATRQRGVKWNLSSRGQEVPPLKGVAGRLSRATENFKETFPFFLAAVVIVQFLAKNNSLTALGAQMYLLGRVLYFPVYAFDIKYLRTLIWGVATLGIVLVLSGAFAL